MGLAAAQANFFITTIFFASFVGDDAISTLTYAWLLMTLPLALFGMAISTAVFPEMAERAANDDVAALRAMITRSLRLILYLTIPSSVGLMLLGGPTVALLLQRGEFDAAAADMTTGALALLSLGLFAHASIEIMSRGFYVLADTRTPMRLALLSMALNFALALALVGPFEERGVAFALTLATSVEAALLYGALRRRLGDLEERETWRSLRRTVAGTVLLAEVVAFFVLGFGLDDPGFGSLLGVTLATALGAGAFFAATWALGSEEARLLAERSVGLLRPR